MVTPSLPMRRTVVPLLFLAACTGASDEGDSAPPDGSSDSGADPVVERDGPAYSKGDCPTLAAGRNDFATGDDSYRVELILPEDPVGAPVVFAWHWLGGSASQAIRSMSLQDFVDGSGVIVVAPDSAGYQYEWHFLDDPDGNPDLLLFDDLLGCLWRQYDVDLERVHAVGMSAGGLWTSYLTLHRAQWLASTAPLSGGAQTGSYSTPAEPLPVLMTWGGPSDLYGPLSFDETSRYMVEQLRADGSFVVECEHDRGHTLPPGGLDYAYRFLLDHPRGIQPEPYADGLPEGFPSFCRQP